MNNNKRKKSNQPLPIKNLAGIILLVLPLSLLIFPALDFTTCTLTVFPADNIQDNIFVADDKVFQGKSVIEGFSCTGGELKLKYQLKPATDFPRVWISLFVGTAEKPLDLTKFKSITLVIREATVKSLTLIIKTFVPGVSKPEPENAVTLRHNQYTLELKPGVKNYTINLNKIITQPWWFNLMKVAKASIPDENYSKVTAFDLQFNAAGSDYTFDKHEQVVIGSISFTKPLSAISLVILIGVALFYTVFLTVLLVQKIRYHLYKLPLPERKPVPVTTYYEKDLMRIKEFLESHYYKPDISTNQIYEQLGIPQPRVTELLQNEYQLSFKQLINRMRIEEAKRLLTQTDLRIIDISLNLGFNNITYFNYLFKTNVGLTPSEFREQELQIRSPQN